MGKLSVENALVLYPSSSNRSKNTVNILIKNWLDMCIGAMVYWAVGFAITFGKSRPGIAYIMGTSYYFFHEMPREYISS